MPVPAAKKPFTVLLLGTDLSSRERLRVQLGERGHRVFEAGSVKAGAVAVHVCLPDLVVVDGRLPDAEDLGWVKAWRDGGVGWRFVFLCDAEDWVALVPLTGSLGVELVVRRPIEAGELVTQIDGFLRARASVPPPVPAAALQTRPFGKALDIGAPGSLLARGTLTVPSAPSLGERVPFELRSFADSEEESGVRPLLDEEMCLDACPIVDFAGLLALRGD